MMNKEYGAINMNEKNNKALKARKDIILIEPRSEGYSKDWESHHATNPCVVRLSKDRRVFLGYRAGGEKDYYRFGPHNVWGSHLGLALLNERGDAVLHRLPLPIMTIEHDVSLPQDEGAYEVFKQGPHFDDILVLHDFRFFEYEDFLYVIYHEGPVHDCYDCIVRMGIDDFLRRVEESLSLMKGPRDDLKAGWRELWWRPGVWSPAGVAGTNRLFASWVNKGDIVFFMLGNGRIQMNHRPLADAIAVVDTNGKLYADVTADGLTIYGTYESCIRPGFLDNSHIGNNGSPTRACIGDVEVYIDVVHGVHNRKNSQAGFDRDAMRYYPYLRVKDYQTGELLYYSEAPILDYDNVWRNYAEEGAWVRTMDHLEGVMFAGGQLEAEKGRNGLDDEFAGYTGLGDTAVGLFRFKLRELLPEKVITDIMVQEEHRRETSEEIAENRFNWPENINGWSWSLGNDPTGRRLRIVRKLERDGQVEEAVRIISTAPGCFDADAMVFDGTSVRWIEDLGWVVVYKGVRWDGYGAMKMSSAGWGILVLDGHNPEKVLYRSSEAAAGTEKTQAGWGLVDGLEGAQAVLDEAERLIPEKVRFEIRRLHDLERRGLSSMAMQMITWQRHKSGLLQREKRFSFTGA